MGTYLMTSGKFRRKDGTIAYAGDIVEVSDFVADANPDRYRPATAPSATTPPSSSAGSEKTSNEEGQEKEVKEEVKEGEEGAKQPSQPVKAPAAQKK